MPRSPPPRGFPGQMRPKRPTAFTTAPEARRAPLLRGWACVSGATATPDTSDQMSDLFRQSEALRHEARRVAVEFLRTELRIANTLLDLVQSRTDAQANTRRRDEARAAYDEVEKQLGEGGSLALSEREQVELTIGVTELGRRLGVTRRLLVQDVAHRAR